MLFFYVPIFTEIFEERMDWLIAWPCKLVCVCGSDTYSFGSIRAFQLHGTSGSPGGPIKPQTSEPCPEGSHSVDLEGAGEFVFITSF